MKRLISILLCLCQPSWAAVAFNSKSSAQTESGVGSASPQTNTTMTVGSGSNTALVCMVSFDKAFATPGTVTVNWDSTGTNQAMTLITSKDNSLASCSVALYGLLNPTSGNHTFRVAWTVGTADLVSWCTDYTGVDQQGFSTSFINAVTAAATSTTPAITITTAAGDLTVDAGNDASFVGTSPTKTVIFNGVTVGATNPWGSRAAGTSTTNAHSWTLSSSAWAEVGIDIVAAGICGSPFCGVLGN